MLGAIAGDVIGSVYEHRNVKHKQFPLFSADSRFTDDTVLTAALAHALLEGSDAASAMRHFHARYPDAGYGPTFRAWVASAPGTPAPRSASNGAAMRISPVAWACEALPAVLAEAKRLTVITHDHAEGVRGAQAVATAVFLARQGADKATLREAIEGRFGYDLSVPLAAIRPAYAFDLSCGGTVPPALRAFLESTDFEDAVRNAVSLGGDSDTLAAIAGAVAEAHYGGVPASIADEVIARLDAPLQALLARFRGRFVG